MKLLKLLILHPHYLVIFLAIGLLYLLELIVEVISFPFNITLIGIELLIKQLLKFVK